MTSVKTSTDFSSNKLLALLIQKIRSTNHLTQTELGELFQPPVTQSTVARWEKGEQMPDRIHFPKIAYFLDFTFEELQKFLEAPVTNLEGLHIEKKTLTPNKTHLRILKRGVKAWNKWRDKNPNIIPELAGVELSYFDLDGINLARADLRRVNLSNGSFRNSSFRNANLRGANFNKVNLVSSCLNRADLSNASLRFTRLNKAELIEADLHKSSLEDVYFSSANLSKTNFAGANLSRIDFREANLNQASLEKVMISDSLVYGASFWGTNLNETKLENVYISPEGREGLPINDLALAQITYLHRHNPSITRKFRENYRLEEEAIRLANIIIEKYAVFSHTYGFCVYSNTNEPDQVPPYYEIRRDADHFFVKIIPDFRDIDLVLSGQANQKIILKIEGEITESNLSSNELENLRNLVRIEAKKQEERANILAPIALQIFKINKSNKFIDQHYFLETINGEVILRTNSEVNLELMRIDRDNEGWNIINSSLSETHITYFQKLLKRLQ